MAKKRAALDEQRALELLRASGYRIKRPDEYVKRGLEVHRTIFARFTELRRKLGLRAYEALAIAMEDWIKKNTPDA